jgi:hypothetical protein
LTLQRCIQSFAESAAEAGPSGCPGGGEVITMTRQGLLRSFISMGVLPLATAAAADRSDNEEQGGRRAQLYLPIAGSVTGGGTFAGTLSVQRFEARDGRVVAIGMVSGSVPGAGTTLAGPLALPVEVGPGSQRAAASPAAAAPQPAAQTCQVLHLALGAVNLNVLGLQRQSSCSSSSSSSSP